MSAFSRFSFVGLTLSALLAAFLVVAPVMGFLPTVIETAQYYVFDADTCASAESTEDCSKAYAFLEVYLVGAGLGAAGIVALGRALLRGPRDSYEFGANQAIVAILGIALCLCGAFVAATSLMAFL